MSEIQKTAFLIDAVHPPEWHTGQAVKSDRSFANGRHKAGEGIGNSYGYHHPQEHTDKKPKFWFGHNIAMVDPDIGTNLLPSDPMP